MRRSIRRPLLLIVAAVALLAAWAARNRAEEPVANWTAPTRDELTEALGPVTSLPARQQRAYSDRGHELKHPPQKGEWLENHFEAGQSYADFVRSRPNKPDAERRKLYIQPLGEFGEKRKPILQQVADFGQRFFLLEVEVQPAIPLQSSFTRRTNEFTEKEQLLTTDVLKFLGGDLPHDAYCRIAVTMTDLYPDPERNYVFGQASLRNRVGVYSFARYDRQFFGDAPQAGDDQRYLRRCLDVFSHEVGHMYGMAHCTHYECLMNGSNNLKEADSQSPHFCPICLRKFAFTTKFDPATRCRSLADFYERHDLDEEALWLRDRARWIEEGK